MALLPMLASAQKFTPDQPEGRGLYLFNTPSLTSMNSASQGWMIMHGEQVHANRLLKSGWCEVRYKSPSTGKEFTGYLKIKTLTPLDEVAKEMKAGYEKRVLLENQTLKGGVILAAAGLVILCLGFLGWIRNLLLAAVVILLSVLEIYFLTHSDGFTFYLPTVVGWKWAVIWFLCFSGFLFVQVFLWFKTMMFVGKKSGAVGNAIGFAALATLGLFVVMIISMFMDTRTGATREAGIFKVFVGVQAGIVVYLFIHGCIRDGFFRTMLVTPLYAVGLAAIGLMAYDMFIVALLLVILLPLMQVIAGGFAKGGFTQRDAGKNADGTTKWEWGDKQ